MCRQNACVLPAEEEPRTWRHRLEEPGRVREPGQAKGTLVVEEVGHESSPECPQVRYRPVRTRPRRPRNTQARPKSEVGLGAGLRLLIPLTWSVGHLDPS